MKNKAPYFQNFPVGFMNDIIKVIKDAVGVGKNLQLIGLPGSGKSLALRMLSSGISELSDLKIFSYDMGLLPEKNKVGVLNMFSEGIKSITHKEKSIFLLDSWDEMMESTDIEIIKVIKSIYDSNRDYMTIVYVTIRPIENFDSLYGDTYFIKPMLGKDLDWFIDGIVKSREMKLDEETRKQIKNVSGGFMAVVKRLLEAVASGKQLGEIIDNPFLDMHLAYQLGLIEEGLNGKKNYFEVPIYNTYLKIKSAKSSFAENIGDLRLKIKLTSLEYKIVSKLNSTRGELVTRDDLIDFVWGKNARGVAEHALDQLIYRLNKKMQKSESKLRVETIRGRGHVLRVS